MIMFPHKRTFLYSGFSQGKTSVYTSPRVTSESIPPAFAERCQGVLEVCGGLRNLRGVVEPFGEVTCSQNRFWGFGELSGVRLPSTKLLWVRQTSAYPRAIRGVLTESCTHTILFRSGFRSELL